jgi:hypothetical protein
MIIYGAGLAGLVTAHVLRRHKPVVYEAQGSLPNNHEALLRFRTEDVSRACGIPFREVEVIKAIRYKGRTISRPDIQINNLYSFKVTGEYHARSIGNTTDCKRFIAPPDFIAQLARGVQIEYKRPLTALEWPERHVDAPAVISTIPMPVMMNLAQWKDQPLFNFKTIWSAWCEITNPVMDLYQTIYYPDPDVPYYRASITGNRVIVEFAKPISTGTEANDRRAICADFEQVLHDFGIRYQPALKDITVKEQRYGKLLPIDDSVRRKFIVAMTDEYRIYSIGRFATWRQILMDDVVKDAERLDKWITDRDSVYKRRLEA